MNHYGKIKSNMIYNVTLLTSIYWFFRQRIYCRTFVIHGVSIEYQNYRRILILFYGWAIDSSFYFTPEIIINDKLKN